MRGRGGKRERERERDNTVLYALLQEPGHFMEKLSWSPSHKQAVYFLPPQFVRRSLVNLNYFVTFSTDNGHLELAFTGVH